MAHQEASRSKYIIAFFVANFASGIAAKLGDLIFSASDYFNSAIRTGEVEQALFASSAIGGLLAVGAWIAVFLMFKNIYFQRMLWYVIAGYVIGGLVGLGALSQMQDLLGLTDTFLLQSALLGFAIAMTVPLFFYVLRKDRYYPPTTEVGQKTVDMEPIGHFTIAGIEPIRELVAEPSVDNTPSRSKREPLISDIEASMPDQLDDERSGPSQYDKARKVIEYNEEAERYWNEVQLLPESYQNRFLQALSDDPLTDLEALAKRLQQENQKELRPYEDDEANELLGRCRAISESAASEFIEIYELLGKKADLNYAFAKIEAKFNTPERLAADAKRTRIERQKAERAAIVAERAAEYHRREAERLAKGKPK